MRFTHKNFKLVKRGRKTATSRCIEQLGYYHSKVGKRSWAIDSSNPARRLKMTITEVQVLPLADVKKYHYSEEGYDSPEEFEQVWRAIYGGFDGRARVPFIRFVLGWRT